MEMIMKYDLRANTKLSTEERCYKKIKIVHIITSLDIGGAQIMLLNLLSKLDSSRYSIDVISLKADTALITQFKEAGVNVVELDFVNKQLWSIQRLIKFIIAESPDVIQTWMYHADFLGGLIGKLFSKAKIIWGIHHTDLNPNLDKKLTLFIVWMCSLLSNAIPNVIVCCSNKTKAVHTRAGYRKEKTKVIPNGFDVNKFHPDRQAYLSLRRELQISDTTTLIGLIGRYHSQKGHVFFFKAASEILRVNRNIHLVLCGEDISYENSSLTEMFNGVIKKRQVHLLGARKDMPDIMAALDICCLAATHGEAFPMIIGEAMACGVPCVVTDVGDSAYMVDNTGVIVPPGDVKALKEGLKSILNLPDEEKVAVGMMARDRISNLFGLEAIAIKYERIYEYLTGC
jgi:glycosyltransferase involved in cell wall biosynthesis